MRIERRVDSVPFMYDVAATAWPASWIATARVSSGTYSMLTAVPDSTVVIASTMSVQPKRSRPSWCAMRQRHRADLLDHRRRVAVRDARELVAALRRVEVGLVADLVEVEVEDVQAVVLRRRPEPDVAAHAARAGERRVEHLDRHVAGADEVDLLAARARRRQPQRALADAARDDVRSRRGTC